MNKLTIRFLSLMLFFLVNVLMFSGCATPTTLVTYPPLPESSKGGSVNFEIHDISQIKFVAENGKNSITKDNVTVTVEDIAEITNDDRFSTTIKGPWGKNHKIGITPMILVLKVKNGTNHIITLRQTILKIEDENQTDYPLISNIPDSKNRLKNKVEKAFDQFLSDIDTHFKKRYLNNSEYNKDYEKFVNELKTASRRGQVKTQDQEKGRVLTSSGIESMIEEKSPKYLYKRDVKWYKNKTSPLKAKAIQNINAIDNNISNIITSGVYPPISLIPGRTTKIVVPFNSRKSNESISELYVNIFDMPTKVDQASNPTKRAHFNFKLVAVK